MKRYNQGGDWQNMETYEGKSVTHAEVSYRENIKTAERRAEALRKKRIKL
jgi:hypothetical protein